MFYTMRCLVLLVFTLTRCRGDSDNSSTSLTLLVPPVPAASRRMSAAQVQLLRRQLMRDNYDYQHSDNERQPNITVRSGGDTKFYYQKDGTNHLPRASELPQANSNAFSAESAQQDQSKQRGLFEQRGQNEQGHQHEQPGEYEHRGQHEQRYQHEQGRHHKQPGEYEHRGQHEQRNQHEQGRHHKQPGEYEHRGQYEQPSEHEQRGQYQQPGEHEQRGRYDPHDRYEQHGPHKQRGQRKHHEQHEKLEQNEQREHSEQQEQLGQYGQQEQAQSIEQKHRAAPSLQDAPPVAVPFTDELTVRKYTPDWRDIQPEQAQEYNPSYYNKRRDAYDPPYPALMERRPFSDLRGNYKEHYGQNDAGNDMRAQDELVSNAQESPDQEYAPDEQEAFDQQDASGTQNDEGSDYSESMKQAKIYNEFVTRSTTRANRLQYYAPDERNAPPLHRGRNASPPHRNAPPPHRSAPPQHRNAPNHNMSKKDLLYYMDDSQLRRRHNDASFDVPGVDQTADDQLPFPQPSPGPNNPAGTRTSPGKPARHPTPTEGELPRTSRTLRSFVVTVSANNVTYKLLTLKSRSGRRQDERRILEEHGPAGVALMSLDHAPLPAFRLPRARRQYMHAPHHHRRHEPA